MNYVILAAGLGSRFAREGITTPKPLVPVMGVPMIGRLIGVLRSLGGCDSIHIVANPHMEGLVEYLERLRADGAPLVIKPIVSDNSYTSLRLAAEGLEGRFVAMTVDTVFADKEMAEFVRVVEAMPPGEVAMALTRYVDDESPLYARVNSQGLITNYRYGGEPFEEGAIVSAGIYGLTAEAMRMVSARERYPESLSDFQRILATETPLKVRMFEMQKAFDVDSVRDRDAAEAFLRRSRSWREEYRESLKSSDTEEHIDLAFYRPIGFAWACLFRRLGISPNAVTIASIFIGIAAGICFYPTTLWINIIGMFLLMWANSYDSADGQLARLTGQYSRLGRILDGMAGDFWFLSIYVAICLRTNHADPWFAAHTWVVWVLAVAAGICHAKQAALADYYRQMHLFFLKGRAGSELDSSAHLARRYAELQWGRQPVAKLIALLYLHYTRSQEAETPELQRLRRLIAERWPEGPLPRQLHDEFLRGSLPLCKWENFMTFNWRTIFLFATLFIGRPWIYFVVELTLFNAVMFYTHHAHERLCRKMDVV